MRENPLSSNNLAELIEKLVSSDEYIQSKNQQDLLKRELDHAPYVAAEKTFREAVDSCIRASRKMRDKIQAVAPFYLGAKDAPAPTPKNRIEHIINPQQTGHCHDLETSARS